MYRLVAVAQLLLLAPVFSWAASGGHLVVADAPAEKLYVYRLPDLELTGEFSEIRIADEVGFVSLHGERVLLVNESGSGHSHDHDEEAEAGEEEEAEGSELIALKLDLQGQPAIIARALIAVSAPSHIVVHPKFAYAAVGGENALTLVDLRWWSAHAYEPIGEITLDSAETGVGIVDNPSLVSVRRITNDFSGGALDAYPVDILQDGEDAPTGTVVLDSEPHGEVLSHKLRRFCSATGVGFACADLQEDTLTRGQTIPYSATPAAHSERAWTARLSHDQRFIFSNIEQYSVEENAPWTSTLNDAYIADIASGEVIRTRLGPGWITTKSYAVASPHVALYALTHTDGDTAFLLDANPNSPTFGQILATIPLPSLQNNPNTVERDPFSAGFQTRNAALSPDGRWGFVTHGGDGRISVIDIQERKIVRTIETPSPLGDVEASFSGGGRVIAVQAGKRLGDTIGR